MSRPIAVGFLRTDLSGTRQAWDETQLRSMAKRHGYDLAKTVAVSGRSGDPVAQLHDTVLGVRAEAVYVPSLDHLGGDVPPVLTKALVEVTAVDTGDTYAPRVATVFEVRGEVNSVVDRVEPGPDGAASDEPQVARDRP